MKNVRRYAGLTSALYVFIYSVLVPLYMPHGYYELGEAKFQIYRIITLIFIVIMTVFAIADKNLQFKGYFHFLLLISAVVRIAGFLHAGNHDAFFGMPGWRDGLFTELTYLLLAFFFSMYGTELRFLAVVLAAPFVVCTGAVLQYATDYMFSAGFFSTIGNANWFAGFLSVFFPAGSGLLTINTIPKEGSAVSGTTPEDRCDIQPSVKYRNKIFLSVYVYITGICVFIQGSDSILLSLILSSVFTCFCAYLYSGSLMPCFYQGIIFGASAETAFLLSILRQVRSFSAFHLLCEPVLRAHTGLIIMLASFLLLMFTKMKASGSARSEGGFLSEGGPGALPDDFRGSTALSLLLPLLLILSVIIQIFFPFTPEWGSGRGEIWDVAMRILKNMSFTDLIFGTGHDMFYNALQNLPGTASQLTSQYENIRVTNAHSELLHMLVTEGLAGAVTFLMLVQITCKKAIVLMKNKHDNYTFLFLLILISYCANNTVSFRQVLSTPVIYIIMGLIQRMTLYINGYNNG